MPMSPLIPNLETLAAHRRNQANPFPGDIVLPPAFGGEPHHAGVELNQWGFIASTDVTITPRSVSGPRQTYPVVDTLEVGWSLKGIANGVMLAGHYDVLRPVLGAGVEHPTWTSFDTTEAIVARTVLAAHVAGLEATSSTEVVPAAIVAAHLAEQALYGMLRQQTPVN